MNGMHTHVELERKYTHIVLLTVYVKNGILFVNRKSKYVKNGILFVNRKSKYELSEKVRQEAMKEEEKKKKLYEELVSVLWFIYYCADVDLGQI
jgi:CMP-N-acetylneuraminic acid synthetase